MNSSQRRQRKLCRCEKSSRALEQRNQSCPANCCPSQVRIHKWRVILNVLGGNFPFAGFLLLLYNLIMLTKYFQLHLMFHSPTLLMFIFTFPCSSETEFVIGKYSALVPFLWSYNLHRPVIKLEVSGKDQLSWHEVLGSWCLSLIFLSLIIENIRLASKSVWGQVVSRHKIYFVTYQYCGVILIILVSEN